MGLFSHLFTHRIRLTFLVLTFSIATFAAAPAKKVDYDAEVKDLVKEFKQSKVPCLNMIVQIYFSDSRIAILGKLENRLKDFPEPVRKEVEMILDNKVKIENVPTGLYWFWRLLRGTDGSVYNPDTRSISIKLPKELRGTLIEGFIRAHETEHALQYAILNHAYKKDRRRDSDIEKNIGSFNWLIELGAIRAEWEFLHNASQEEIEITKQLVEATHLSKFMKTFYTRVLSNSKLPFDRYLEKEYEAKRYNRNSFKDLEFNALLNRDARYVVPIAMLGIGGAYYSCTVLYQKPPAERDSWFFKNICSFLLRLPDPAKRERGK